MSLLKSHERAQVDSAVEIFSKVEGEIRDLVRREAAAPQLLPNCTELTGENIGSLLRCVSADAVSSCCSDDAALGRNPSMAFAQRIA